MLKRIFLIWLLCAGLASAANFHCGPSATGTGSGADWNNKADGDTISLTRGNTYYLSDGTYAARTINTANSGTSRIIIQKATEASHGIATGWQSADGDGQAIVPGGYNIFDCGYITIDGQFKYGIRLNIAHGDNGIYIENTTSGKEMDGIQIKFVEISGPAGTGPFFWTLRTNGIYGAMWKEAGGSATFIDDLLVSNCYIHGFETLMQTANTRNAILEYTILADSITSSTNPNDPHPNGWYQQNGNGDIVRYCELRNYANTGWYPNNNGVNLQYYGNWTHSGVGGTGGVSFGIVPYIGTFTNIQVYNNTFSNIYMPINMSYAGPPSTSVTGIGRNNLIYGSGGIPSGSSINWAVVNHNYNWYSGGSTFGEANSIAAGSTNPFSVAPQISSTISALLPRNKGEALAAQFNTDPLGVTRGSDGGWDIGAFESGAAGDTTPPTVQTATVESNGTTVIFHCSETMDSGGGGTATVSGLSGGTVTLTFSSVSGSDVSFTTSRTINAAETGGTVGYTQPGNGLEDIALNDLATFSGLTLTNNSTQGIVATPTFSPVGGPYFGTQNVTISSATTPPVTIHYKTDGGDPTTSDPIYSSPLPFSSGTILKALATKATFANSQIATASYEIGSWTASSGGPFKTFTLPQKAAGFTWTFDVTPSSASADSGIGLGPDPVTGFPGMAVIILFDPDGTIYVRNGAAYGRVNVINYASGVPATSYHFTVTGDIATDTYSVTCAPSGGSPIVLATNYAFRFTVTELDNVGMFTALGSTIVNNMEWTTPTPPGTGDVDTINATNLIIIP